MLIYKINYITRVRSVYTWTIIIECEYMRIFKMLSCEGFKNNEWLFVAVKQQQEFVASKKLFERRIIYMLKFFETIIPPRSSQRIQNWKVTSNYLYPYQKFVGQIKYGAFSVHLEIFTQISERLRMQRRFEFNLECNLVVY